MIPSHKIVRVYDCLWMWHIPLSRWHFIKYLVTEIRNNSKKELCQQQRKKTAIKLTEKEGRMLKQPSNNT